MRRLLPLVLPVLALAVGCGGGKTAPVSGRVTFDGKPLANAHVLFSPIATSGIDAPGAGSYARTDANGRFTLRMVNPEGEGAIVGKHRVAITLLNDEKAEVSDVATKLPVEPIPARYNLETELTFEVPAAGTDLANFDLKSR